jgi:chromosomal replication initiator protein
MMDNKQLWEHTLTELELVVSKANFNTWFKNTFISKQDAGVIYLCVPNAFVKDWLLTKYHKHILRCLRSRVSGVRNIEYVISKNTDLQEQDTSKQEDVVLADQLQLAEFQIQVETGLNPRYTFDSFVVGSFNELAYAAGQAVIKNPGMAYNPLFVYGGTGLGKTHLIQAIGSQIKKHYPDKKIYYITSEKFTLHYIDSVQNNKMHIFKEKYRKYDLLIMDDIQFISGKEKTQEELFHLFNSLYENNKQIIFSSDKPPKYIPQLEDRLRSRFEGGMIVDVSKPDYESRLAILKSKTQNSKTALGDETIEYIASIIQDNIRELEGVLNSIVCQAQLKKRELSIQEIKQLIKNNIQPQKSVSIKDVIRVVSEFYNINERSLFEKTRRKEIVKPRQVVMYLLREDLNTSYPYIGQKLGGRDHTTVIHACEKIKKDVQINSILSKEIEQIKGLLYNNV